MNHRKCTLAAILILLTILTVLSSCSQQPERNPYRSRNSYRAPSGRAFDGVSGMQAVDLDKGLVAHWKFDGDVSDSKTGLRARETPSALVYTDAIHGKGAVFNGEQFLTVTRPKIMTNKISYSFWINPKDSSDRLVLRDDPNIADTVSYGSNGVKFSWAALWYGIYYSTFAKFGTFGTEALPINQWTQVVITMDFTSGEKSIYLNGNPMKTVGAQPEELTPFNYKDGFSISRIGGISSTPIKNLLGSLDDLRVYDRVLTPDEAIELAKTPTFDPDPQPTCTPPPSGLVGWWPGDGDASDVLGKNPGEIVGRARATGEGKVGQAFTADTSEFDNYVQVPSREEISFLKKDWDESNGAPFPTEFKDLSVTGPITIEAWVRLLNLDGKTIVVKRGWSWFNYLLRTTSLYDEWGPGFLVYCYSRARDLTDYRCARSTTKLQSNVYHHIAITFDPATGSIMFYIDGKPDAPQQWKQAVGQYDWFPRAGDTVVEDLLAPLIIGQGSLYGSAVDELSIYNRVLTPGEVDTVFRAGGAGKCPPRTPPPPQPCELHVYSDWEPCDATTRTQTRELYRSHPLGCVGGAPKVTTQSCTPCTSHTYSAWSPCDRVTLTQSRTVLGSTPSGCSGGPEQITTQSCTLAPVCARAPLNLVGWWPGEGTTQDLAAGRNATLKYDINYGPGKIGQGFNLNGGFVDLGSTTENSPTKSMTLSAWIKPTTVTRYQRIIDRFHSGSSGYGGYSLLVSPSKGLLLQLRTNSLHQYGIADILPQPNTFYHVAATYDGSTIKLYVNGELKGSQAASGPITYTASDYTRIGWNPITGGAEAFGGVIDEAQLFERALTAEEIKSIVDSQEAGVCKPCRPQGSGLTGWWPGEGNALDLASGRGGTLRYDITYGPGKIGQGFSLNGGFVDLGSTTENSPTSAMTLSAWIKPTSVTRYQRIIDKFHSGSGGWGGYSLLVTPGKGVLVQLRTTTLNQVSIPDILPEPNQFYHVTATYDGLSIKIYVNGELKGSQAASGPITYTASDYTRIGWNPITGGAEAFGGIIDDVQIYNQAITPAQIAANSKAGATGTCPT